MDDHGYFDNDGKWNSENKERFQRFLRQNAHKRAVLKVKKWYPQRTTPQNDYLHWAFEFLAKETHHTMLEIKGAYKVMLRVPHTSDLDTLGLAKFVDDFRAHALDFFGIYVPLPNEVIYD